MGTVTLLLTLGFYVLTEWVVMDSFLQLERDFMRANAGRMHTELRAKTTSLDARRQEWA